MSKTFQVKSLDFPKYLQRYTYEKLQVTFAKRNLCIKIKYVEKAELYPIQ